MLDARDRDAFHRDGFLVVRGALAGDRLAAVRTAAERVRATAERDLPRDTRFVPTAGGRADPERRTAARTWGVGEITRPTLHDPLLIDTIAAPAIHTTLEGLLDRPRAWGQKLLWGPRGHEYVLHWHRDVPHAFDSLMPFKPVANDHVQFNAALDEDPAFRVVPGSHRRALTAAEWAAMDAQRAGPMPGEVQVTLGPGDVLFMDAHALHRGEVPAGHPRLSLHFSFQAQWVPLWPWGEPEDFAWITSDAFIAALHPDAQVPYRRLLEAERAPTQYGWLVAHARAHGWSGEDPADRPRRPKDQAGTYA